MADMHIIDGDGKKSWRVVMHFDVPDINNDIGISYRTALVTSGLARLSILPDGDGSGGTIDADEKAALAAGTVYEHVVAANLDGTGTTNASRIASLKALYSAAETETVNNLKRRLKLFGHNQDSSP